MNLTKFLKPLISFTIFLFCTFSFPLLGNDSDVRLTLLHKYEFVCREPSDIYEHLPVLRSLARECSSVVEMGLRDMTSSWAILQGLSESPASSRSYLGIDINSPPSYTLELTRHLSNGVGIAFDFWQGNNMDMDIEPTEMLFIDTYHIYLHLTYELEKFSPKVSKYIAMHDTSAPYGDMDEDHINDSVYPPEYDRTKRGLWQAVVDFLERHPEWALHERRLNNHGFTILKRIQD